MKISDIEDDDNIKRYLKITDFDNFFDVYEDADGNRIFNLNSSVQLSIDDALVSEYVCDCRMQWTLLSYKIYSTTRLAWLLMKLNGVKCRDAFVTLEPGTKVKYLPREYMQNVVEQITDFNED